MVKRPAKSPMTAQRRLGVMRKGATTSERDDAERTKTVARPAGKLAGTASTTTAAQTKEHQLITAIRSKKGLETLDDDFVKQKVDKIFGANNKLKAKFEQSKDFPQFSRSKEYEELLKRVRKELRAIYGVFQHSGRCQMLDRLRTMTDEKERANLVLDILDSHQSTKERIPYYEAIYREICSRIKPTSVVDLGCGMNPLAYHHFTENGCKPTMFASDISEKDMEFLQDCFKILGIPGQAKAMDLTQDYERLSAITADVTFLFKLLDSLEEAHRHISYKIFENIKTRWIVASFPTKSLGGKKNIARAGRTWFERLLSRKGFSWETFSVDNELFYVIRNTP